MSPPAKKTVIGLFVEGSLRDRTRNSVDTLWKELAKHCGAEVDLRVYGIDKSQVLALKPGALPKGKNPTSIQSGRPRLDAEIDRMIKNDGLDRVIVAFDAWPENEFLNPSCMRSEIEFLLTGLAASDVLPAPFLEAARRQAERYLNPQPLVARSGTFERIEVLYMDPMFEALFVEDEGTVRDALGHATRPKDWPKFKTRERKLDKFVLAPAVDVAHKDVKRKVGGDYLDFKTAWGLRIVEQAKSGAALWSQEIYERFCRLLHDQATVPTS